MKELIKDYEKERKFYQDILDLESLEEYKYDVNSFKNTVLKNQIPIIRKTLQNKQVKVQILTFNMKKNFFTVEINGRSLILQ
ncbi:hypothetical protein NUACC26_042480 [Scytonema sp. NUACC26]